MHQWFSERCALICVAERPLNDHTMENLVTSELCSPSILKFGRNGVLSQHHACIVMTTIPNPLTDQQARKGFQGCSHDFRLSVVVVISLHYLILTNQFNPSDSQIVTADKLSFIKKSNHFLYYKP